MAEDSLNRFRAFVAHFSWITGLALAATFTAPLAGFIANAGPSWPEKSVPTITFFAQIFALIWMYHFWSSDPKPKLNRRLRFHFFMTLVLFLIYLICLSSYTGVDDDGKRVLIGHVDERTQVQIALLALWLALFTTLTGFVSAFVIYHTQDTPPDRMSIGDHGDQ